LEVRDWTESMGPPDDAGVVWVWEREDPTDLVCVCVWVGGWVREREREFVRVCVCVCVWVKERERTFVCVCVCV